MRRAALLLLLPAGCLLLSWFGFFFFRDNFSTHYPIKVLSQRAFQSGEIPWWNFADGGGQPLAGNPNTLTFYPDNILYLFLPAHVAFNLHFLIHLVAGWFAMRALTRSPWCAWIYVLSGFALSATALYTLVTAVALIPFALWAAEQRRIWLLGIAFGLLALATEPFTILATAIAVAIVAFDARLLLAIPIAAIVASPQLIAYAEIAGEVERIAGFSAATTLNTSLTFARVAEIVLGPWWFPRPSERLFVSLFLGIVAVPALLRRSRYTLIAWVMLFFALGRTNPIVNAAVEALPIRIARYPEKFAMVLIVALVVAAAPLLERRLWRWLTLVPLMVALPFTLPIDWFAPYRIQERSTSPPRVVAASLPGGGDPVRADYRARALLRVPLFGAIEGFEYALLRSPDNMHSLPSRIACERWAATHNRRWVEIATAPPVRIVPRTVSTTTIGQSVNRIESSTNDVAPIAMASDPNARIVSYAQRGQTITVDVLGPALICLNETYFRAWDAGGLKIMPVNLDRLGIIVPDGTHHIELRFGRRHGLIVAAWALSLLTIAAGLLWTRRNRAIDAASTHTSAASGH